MAYMNQQKKKALAPAIKDILAQYGLKGSLSVSGHSSLILKIKSGMIDFIRNYNETIEHYNRYAEDWRMYPKAETYIAVNEFHLDKFFSGRALQCLEELSEAMNVGNHDNSDIQSDYFDVGWYTDIRIGSWNEPYIYMERQ